MSIQQHTTEETTMSAPDDEIPQGGINSTFSGENRGQVAVGTNIRQEQTIGATEPITDDDREEMRRLLEELKARIATEVPEADQAAAQLTVSTLEKEVGKEKPSPSTLQLAINWVKENIPTMATWVGSAMVSPFVRKVVEAAGAVVAKGIGG
ncbi:MAG TPA: hypothetical protein VNA88_12310 [Candidatus Kapabacteria bacterium]|jgi:hypothetical protein|nr:hypothetical protein [Candidatus Kapabacteria bacterium]